MIPGQLKMNRVYDLLAFSGSWKLSWACQGDMVMAEAFNNDSRKKCTTWGCKSNMTLL